MLLLEEQTALWLAYEQGVSAAQLLPPGSVGTGSLQEEMLMVPRLTGELCPEEGSVEDRGLASSSSHPAVTIRLLCLFQQYPRLAVSLFFGLFFFFLVGWIVGGDFYFFCVCVKP